MDISIPTFQWLAQSGIMQDAYIARKKKTAYMLTAQATNAFQSGHVVFYLCCNVLAAQGHQVQQQLAGTMGDPLAPDAMHYNWHMVCDMLQYCGLPMGPDHRMLLANGDPGIIMDLLGTCHKKFTGGGGGTAAQQQAAADRRQGARSVDFVRESAKLPNGKFDPAIDLELWKKKHQQKLEKQEAKDERKKRQDEIFRIVSNKFLTEHPPTALMSLDAIGVPPVPCFRDFANKANVHICHDLVWELVRMVVSGEARRVLDEKERERRMLREAAEARRAKPRPAVEGCVITAAVTQSKDRLAAMFCFQLVEELIDTALQPGMRLAIELKERDRRRQALAAQGVTKRAAEAIKATKGVKYAEGQQQREEDIKQAQAAQEKLRLVRRVDCCKRAAAEMEILTKVRKEKEIVEKLEAEKEKRQDAERVLYHAEQKARVLEARRVKAIEDEEEETRKKEAEEAERELRRARAAEVSRKLHEKELQREAVNAKTAASVTSLSPVSIGTGLRAAYSGPTLGWQFLTAPEARLAELTFALRADPQTALPLLHTAAGNIKGKALWFPDDTGKRHPMLLCEGPQAVEALQENVRRLKRQSLNEQVSIGLTLAARLHAADLAHHAMCDPTAFHVSSDGSAMASQRALRYGSGLGGPNTTHEAVFSVVRPINVAITAEQVLTVLLLDDGKMNVRENREVLLRPVPLASSIPTEIAGFGHAIADFHGAYAVEVYVILFVAPSYMDRPVLQMANAQQTAVGAVAPCFLLEQRVVAPGITHKRDMYSAVNITIGRKETSNPQLFKRLAARKSKVGMHLLGAQAADRYYAGEEGEAPPPPALVERPPPPPPPTVAQSIPAENPPKAAAAAAGRGASEGPASPPPRPPKGDDPTAAAPAPLHHQAQVQALGIAPRQQQPAAADAAPPARKPSMAQQRKEAAAEGLEAQGSSDTSPAKAPLAKGASSVGLKEQQQRGPSEAPQQQQQHQQQQQQADGPAADVDDEAVGAALAFRHRSKHQSTSVEEPEADDEEAGAALAFRRRSKHPSTASIEEPEVDDDEAGAALAFRRQSKQQSTSIEEPETGDTSEQPPQNAQLAKAASSTGLKQQQQQPARGSSTALKGSGSAAVAPADADDPSILSSVINILTKLDDAITDEPDGAPPAGSAAEAYDPTPLTKDPSAVKGAGAGGGRATNGTPPSEDRSSATRDASETALPPPEPPSTST